MYRTPKRPTAWVKEGPRTPETSRPAWRSMVIRCAPAGGHSATLKRVRMTSGFRGPLRAVLAGGRWSASRGRRAVAGLPPICAAGPVLAGVCCATGLMGVAWADRATLSCFLFWCTVAIVVSAIASKGISWLRNEVRQGRRLGQYTIGEKIGAGGMGVVYKAHHVLLRRPAAIKLLRRDLAGKQDLARFEREAQLTSRLTHPNTIVIYDYGHTPDGLCFYAMEYVPGLNLADLVRLYGPQPPERVIHILKQVCGSLTEAHGIGLIHRDIKAANVILCERGGAHDVVKVLDF